MSTLARGYPEVRTEEEPESSTQSALLTWWTPLAFWPAHETGQPTIRKAWRSGLLIILTGCNRAPTAATRRLQITITARFTTYRQQTSRCWPAGPDLRATS